MTGVAQAKPPSSITSEHACLSPVFPAGQNVPAEWTDLNKRYGVSERIVGPPPSVSPLPQTPGCLEAFAGEKLVRAVPPWIMAPDKVASFTNSFKSARYVIDEGTAQEKTITVGPNVLQSGKVPLLPNGYPPDSISGAGPRGPYPCRLSLVRSALLRTVILCRILLIFRTVTPPPST